MPLLVDDKDNEREEPYEFEEGQENIAKLIHLVWHHSNNDLYFEILMKFKRVFVKGGQQRMKFTLPAVIFSLFRLSQEMINREQSPPVVADDEEVKDSEV